MRSAKEVIVYIQHHCIWLLNRATVTVPNIYRLICDVMVTEWEDRKWLQLEPILESI